MTCDDLGGNNGDPFGTAQTLPQGVTLRRLCAGDSLDELTALLHRAFARLGKMGVNCTCVDQSVAVTRERVTHGECYVALLDDRLIATMTLHEPDARSKGAWRHRRSSAGIHQLAVDPDYQACGIGTALLDFAEAWARARGHGELTLHTPQPAQQLREFYRRRGYRMVGFVRLAGKRYRSVVLSKRVDETRAASQRAACFGRAPRQRRPALCWLL
jgi:GNAT superfamily N-acetyltransferase